MWLNIFVLFYQSKWQVYSFEVNFKTTLSIQMALAGFNGFVGWRIINSCARWTKTLFVITSIFTDWNRNSTITSIVCDESKARLWKWYCHPRRQTMKTWRTSASWRSTKRPLICMVWFTHASSSHLGDSPWWRRSSRLDALVHVLVYFANDRMCCQLEWVRNCEPVESRFSAPDARRSTYLRRNVLMWMEPILGVPSLVYLWW